MTLGLSPIWQMVDHVVLWLLVLLLLAIFWSIPRPPR